ncbi:YqeB family protein [Phytohabitans rumicis]|nr:hypothetical protein [Phytohabitans rumicis]
MDNETVVSDPAWATAVMWGGLPVAGAGAAWALQAAAGWLASLPWVPFEGPLNLVASVADAEPQATIGALAIGGLAGLVLAFIGAQETLSVTVAGDRVLLGRGDSAQEIGRAAVTAVFVDGKKLVLQGRDAEEIAREGFDLSADRLREAFVAHGYPWATGGDPYRSDFRRWVPDDPDLPGSAAAVLKARAKALDKDDKTDIKELGTELAKLGIVVREEGKRQYWRRTRQHS